MECFTTIKEVNTKGTGLIIKCMEKELYNMQMEELHIKVIGIVTSFMGKECFTINLLTS